jgi:glutamine cyclotransferase
MGTTRSLKCHAALFCFFSVLFFGFSLHESSAGVDPASYNESAPARQVETAPLHSPERRFAPVFEVRVLGKFPHDPDAFTQGLIFVSGFLYESTGLNGRSSLRKVELETGRVLKKYNLPFQYFGEGLASWNGSLIQLTWKSGTGFVYNPENFAVEREFSYSGEGWGLTNDGKNLIMSNGTDELIFLDPATLVKQYSLRALDAGRPVSCLNELEYIRGEIFANIWHEDFVAIISPKTGEVSGWIDMSPLRKELPPGSNAEALNGIAYDEQKGRIFVTGKLWPLLFEIEIIKP